MAHFHPQKRFLIALPLAILMGLIVLSSLESIYSTLSAPWMWSILTGYLVLGLVIGLAGAYTHHPIFGFPIPWYIRGGILGIFSSLPIAFGSMYLGEDPAVLFLIILGVGGIIGGIIDFFSTRYGGEGKNIAG